jgi:hypothetical protein
MRSVRNPARKLWYHGAVQNPVQAWVHRPLGRCRLLAGASSAAESHGRLRHKLPVHNGEPGRQIDKVGSFVSSFVRRSRHNGYSVPEWVHQQDYLNPYPKELFPRNHV